MRDRVALLVAFTVCAVLVGIVVDLTFAATLSEVDRAASLAALGAMGLALAHGLAKWFDRGDD